MQIETKRLIITELTEDMAYDLHKNSLDEDTRRFLEDEVFETEEDAKETIEFLMSKYDSKEGPFVYPVFIKESKENIGYVELAKVKEGFEVGYHIAKPYTKQGFAKEATAAFLPVIAEKLGLEEIYGVCLKENIASIKVLESIGFETFFEGESKYGDRMQEVVKSVWKK